MDIDRLDANLLVSLDAILTDQNLTRAGQRVGRTQSAMSGVLAKLRVRLDDQLLIRDGRSYMLTPRGEQLLPIVHEAVAAVTRTLQMRQDFDPLHSRRRFVIGASDYALAVLTSPLLQLADRAAPNVSLDFEPLPSSAALDPIDLLRQDLVIASEGRGVPGRSETIFEDRFVVVADESNPLAQRGRLSLVDLEQADWVGGVFGVRTPVEDVFAAIGIRLRIGRSCPGFLSVPFFVAGTPLLGMVPSRIVGSSARPSGVIAVETELPVVELVEMAYWHPNSDQDSGLIWLRDALKALRLDA